MRFPAGGLALLLTALWLLPAKSPSQGISADSEAARARATESTTVPGPPATEKLNYDVEWRLVHAGTVIVESQKSGAGMKVESAGLVSSLFKIKDAYSVDYDEPFCATSTRMDSQEGKRHHETDVTYDRGLNRATFLERDVLKDAIIHRGEVDIPNCVHEVLGAFLTLRSMSVEPGQSVQIPMSDGRRSAPVKVEAHEREQVKTPAGTYTAIRYEAFMLNGVIYRRKGRAFLWLSDDPHRLPVQIQLRMQFPIGTITLQLQKEEHT